MKEDIIFEWDLSRFHPRLDRYLPEMDSAISIIRVFQFAVRLNDCTNTHRHYRLPIRFHIPLIRAYYQKRIVKAVENYLD